MQPMAYAMLGADKFHALFGKDKAGRLLLPRPASRCWTPTAGHPYWMPGTQTLDIDEADLAFAQGKSTFNVGGTFTLAFLAQNGLTPSNVLTFPVPAPAGGANKNLTWRRSR